MAKLSLCAYSESGGGKSTLIIEVLRWLREKGGYPKAKGRIATVEHTGTYAEEEKEGLVEIWDMNTREKPFETVDAAARGRWPKDPKDPSSELVQTDFNEYILQAMEGISTIAQYMGGSYVSGGLAARAGRGDRIGPAEETISFKDGTRAVGGNARAHYNIVQGDMQGAVANSHKNPVFLIWTAHETKAKDDLSGMPIVGPDVFGLKATQHVPRWFSSLLYLSSRPVEKQEMVDVGGKKEKMTVIDNEYFLWLKTHFEPGMPNIPIKAKNCLGAKNQKDVPAFLRGGGLAIGDYLDLMVKYGKLEKGGG